MSTPVAVRCEACGGAVAMEAGERVPRCLFCGNEALLVEDLPEEIEAPGTLVPFTLDAAGALASFRSFARSSIWYPGDLRRAKLDLNDLYLPAWIWSGHVETHYAALVKARTRSGKRPVTGSESVDLSGVLVPSSRTLTRSEVHAISPFDSAQSVPFVSGGSSVPYELGSLTRTAARAAAYVALEEAHRARIASQLSSVKLSSSSLHTRLQGDPVLLPVFVGAYRRGKKVYRVVINGQTGKLSGRAPVSWLRVGCAVFGVLAVLGMIFACLGGGGLVASYGGF